MKNTYFWRDDIIDLTTEDNEEWLNDVVEANYQKLYEEDELDFINLFAISKKSKLYDYIQRWYGYEEDAYIRCYMEDCRYIYFVSGCNYAIFDMDLLNGNANGNAQRVFNIYVDYFENMSDNMKNLSKYNDIVIGTSIGTVEDATVDKFSIVASIYEKELSTDKVGVSCDIVADGIEISIDYGDYFSGAFNLTVEKW